MSCGFRLEVAGSIFAWICAVCRIAILIEIATLIGQEYHKEMGMYKMFLYACLSYANFTIIVTFCLVIGIRKGNAWLIFAYIVLNTLEILLAVALTAGASVFFFDLSKYGFFALVLTSGILLTAILIAMEVVLFIVCDRYSNRGQFSDETDPKIQIEKPNFFALIVRRLTKKMHENTTL